MNGRLVSIAVEGPADVGVAEKLLTTVGFEMAGPPYLGRGKANLDRQLNGYRNAARFAPWFVIRDLDNDAPCAGELVERLVPSATSGLCFRIAVRSAESWLIADRECLAVFLGISAAKIPRDPESLPNPKTTLVDLARHSRNRAVREDMVPEPGTSARVGPNYVHRVNEYAAGPWRPRIAARASRSLTRCIAALERLK
jgi:hypothetical protein